MRPLSWTFSWTLDLRVVNFSHIKGRLSKCLYLVIFDLSSDAFEDLVVLFQLFSLFMSLL